MKKIIAVLTIALVSILTITGCDIGQTSSNGEQTSNNIDPIFENSIVLKDGRTVICLIRGSISYRGGMTCDWDNAKVLP